MSTKRDLSYLEKYRYEKMSGWEEPCTAQINLKMPKSMKDALISIDNWNQVLRLKIAELLDEISNGDD